MYRYEVGWIQEKLEECLLFFIEGFAPEEKIKQATKILCDAYFDFHEGRITKKEYRQALLTFFEGQIKLLQKPRALTERQRRFVRHFVACGSATKAAKMAGYSPRTANVIACENLKKPQIIAAIKKMDKSYGS